MHPTPIHYHTENIAIIDIPSQSTKPRRSYARTSRNGRGGQQEDVPWTAARCQRLLRTISSRIHILRRLSENDFAEQFLRTPKAKRKRDISIDPVGKLGSRLAALETPGRADDPDWFPRTENRGAAKTYGERHRLKKHPATTQGLNGRADVGLRTPYIRSLLRPEAMVSPISPAEDPYSTSSRLGQMGRRAKQDAIQPKTHAERALKTLLDSFDSLLSSTDPAVPAPRRGVSSLQSMCLRRVPAYIDYEQRWAEEMEDDYVFDATETIYVQLENMGQGSWSSLRELVRAHAVMLITDAMRERMWPLQSLDTLMEICARHCAVIESQQLLFTWLESSTGKIEEPQKKFVDYAVKYGGIGFMFRTLAELATTDDVKCSEASLNRSIWKELPTAFARRSYHADAATFLRKFAFGCQLWENSIDCAETTHQSTSAVLEELLCLLTSMALIGVLNNGSNDDRSNIMADRLHRLAVEVGQDVLSSTEITLDNNGVALEVANRFLTCSLMMHAALGTYEPEDGQVRFHASMDLLHELDLKIYELSLKRRKDVIRARVTFMMDVARLSECAEVGVSRRIIIKQTACGLLQATGRLSSSKAFLLKILASDMATVWAESQLDNESQDFADDIQRLAVSRSPDDISQCTNGNDQLSGFHWEAAIGEWVAAATPLVRPFRRVSNEISVDGQDSGIGMSETDTPSRKPGPPVVSNSDRQLPPRGSVEVKSAIEFAALDVSIKEPPPRTRIQDAADPDRDELSLSPQKSNSRTWPIVIFNDPEHIRPTHLETEKPSGTNGLCRIQERDELAMTPLALRQPLTPVQTRPDRSKVKAKSARRGAVQVTPARMFLRSHKKPRAEDKENEGEGEGVSDDELGL